MQKNSLNVRVFFSLFQQQLSQTDDLYTVLKQEIIYNEDSSLFLYLLFFAVLIPPGNMNIIARGIKGPALKWGN